MVAKARRSSGRAWIARAACAGDNVPRRTRPSSAWSSAGRMRGLRRTGERGLRRERTQSLLLEGLEILGEPFGQLLGGARPVHLLADPPAAGQPADVPGHLPSHRLAGG